MSFRDFTDLERQFDNIAKGAINAAECVQCTLPEFYAGLRAIRAEITDRIAVEADEVDTTWEQTILPFEEAS